MFGKKEKPRRNHGGKDLSQYGLFNIPTNFESMGNNDEDDDDDSDLESELAALSDGGAKPKPRKPAKKPIPQADLDAMVSDSMKDIASDEDVDVDENDPDLLSELHEITGAEEEPEQEESPPQYESNGDVVNVLRERLKNYEIAEGNAKSAGESSKARRYGRAIKTLKDLIKQANAGRTINLNDDSIPPEIRIGITKNEDGEQPSVPTRTAPSVPTPVSESAQPLPESVQNNVAEAKQSIDQELLGMLEERQKEYKIAALHAKKSGDNETAVKFVRIAKQFDKVIEAVNNGQEVDLSQMPGPPNQTVPKPKVERSETQQSAETAEPPATSQNLITATTVLEALEQRIQVYRDHENKAKEESNTSKARRYGRIVKQYEQAIKSHKAGRQVAYDELPVPPGYGPIPGQPVAQVAPVAPPPKPEAAATPPKASPESDEGEGESEKPKQPTPGSSRISGNRMSTTHQEKQILILQAKQKQFKLAALNAKKKGEITEAKEFLKQAKGFDKLIEAAQAGLPVDWSSIPVSPEAKSQLDNEYDMVMSEECTDKNNEDIDVLSRLEFHLNKQLKMCLTTRDHNKALGDVAGMNRFERLALNVTKDLDLIRVRKKTGGSVPKFHYEKKDFSIVKSFTEISDNSMELTIVRGVNFATDRPDEIDTYVKFEFPFPQETPFSDKTGTVKNTNNPEYNSTFVIPIQRNSRQCQRVFKRHGIKLEVYSRGCDCCASDLLCCFSGFFRSDALLGTVNLKLQPLETQCELHDSFELLEGRRKVGGKLEIRVRLRTPIVTQQVEQIQEKWLVIDE